MRKILVVSLMVLRILGIAGCASIDIRLSIDSSLSLPQAAQSRPATDSDQTELWKDLYKFELNKYIARNDENNNVMFNLIDLDDNAIPELLVSQGQYHGASAEVYTIIDGNLTLLGSFGSWGISV